MASGGSRSCHSPRQNLPPIDPIEDKLARDLGPVGGPHSDSISPVPFRTPTSSPDLVPALIFTLVPLPVPTLPSFDKWFRQFIKAYLELNQGPRQPPAERERFFKAKVPDVYYRKSYMDCYHNSQQCKDHFETAGATRVNRTPFAAFFLCGSISIQWTQYKRRHRGEEPTSITSTEFKTFLWKNLGKSKSFVDSI